MIRFCLFSQFWTTHFFGGEVHNKNVNCLSDFSGDSRTWAEHRYSRRHLDTFWTRTGFGSEERRSSWVSKPKLKDTIPLYQRNYGKWSPRMRSVFDRRDHAPKCWRLNHWYNHCQSTSRTGYLLRPVACYLMRPGSWCMSGVVRQWRHTPRGGRFPIERRWPCHWGWRSRRQKLKKVFNCNPSMSKHFTKWTW